MYALAEEIAAGNYHQKINREWISWARQEFLEELIRLLVPVPPRVGCRMQIAADILEMDVSRLRNLFDTMKERAGIDWQENEHNAWKIDVTELAEACTSDDLIFAAHGEAEEVGERWTDEQSEEFAESFGS